MSAVIELTVFVFFFNYIIDLTQMLLGNLREYLRICSSLQTHTWYGFLALIKTTASQEHSA